MGTSPQPPTNPPNPPVPAIDSAHHASHHLTAHQRKWLTATLTAILVVSLAAAVYMAVRSPDEIVHYRVILLLLFFAISSISSLIFTSAPQVELKGDFYGLALSVGGPAALWLIALLLFSQFYKEDRISSSSMFSLVQSHVQSQREIGWQIYPEWKSAHHGLRQWLGRSDSEQLSKLMLAAHFTPPGEKMKLPVVSTLFVYFPGKISLKLQRIRGEQPGGELTVHFAGLPSTKDGRVASMLLATSNLGSKKISESFVATEPKHAPEAKLTNLTQVDALLVSLYEDDNPGDGDYTVVDLKRFSQDAQGSIYLGVLSFDRTLERFAVSHLQPSYLNNRGTIPVMFQVEPAVDRNLDALRAELAGWMQLLDARDQNRNGLSADAWGILTRASGHLKASLACRQGLCFQSLFTAEAKDVRAVSLPRAEQATLALFSWY